MTPWAVALQAPLSMEFSRQRYWSRLPFPSPGDLPNPGIEPRCPALQADSLPAEPQGKPNNTGVGSLSLLQQIFWTQGLNWRLLHCRWIVYQLSYQKSPFVIYHHVTKLFTSFTVKRITLSLPSHSVLTITAWILKDKGRSHG